MLERRDLLLLLLRSSGGQSERSKAVRRERERDRVEAPRENEPGERWRGVSLAFCGGAAGRGRGRKKSCSANEEGRTQLLEPPAALAFTRSARVSSRLETGGPEDCQDEPDPQKLSPCPTTVAPKGVQLNRVYHKADGPTGKQVLALFLPFSIKTHPQKLLAGAGAAHAAHRVLAARHRKGARRSSPRQLAPWLLSPAKSPTGGAFAARRPPL
ncbi:hypothetical protein NL676_023469 [Syzygium grande]|nr:hypothetical protein NL676_023469 [Syzygium grande]